MISDSATDRSWIIDSHVHLDILHHRIGPRVNWFQENHCTVISWAYGTAIHTTHDLQSYLSSQARIIAALHDQSSWGCFFLAGIHPRNIPPDLGPEMVADLLTPYLSQPNFPASLQEWMPQLVNDFLAPLQSFTLGILIAGVVLLVVSLVYKPREVT